VCVCVCVCVCVTFLEDISTDKDSQSDYSSQESAFQCQLFSMIPLNNAELFQPKFGSNLDKPKCWVRNVISTVHFLNYIFNPTFGCVHIWPKFGLKQPSIFLEFTILEFRSWIDEGHRNALHVNNTKQFAVHKQWIFALGRIGWVGEDLSEAHGVR